MAGVQHVLAFLYLLTISVFHLTYSKPNGFSLKMIPRDSPESPIYPGNLTALERIERLIRFSKARARYLELRSAPNATIEPESISLTLLRDNFFYMVQASIGTAGTRVFLLLDTGGGLIWTQCQPCVNCYRQRFPIYDSRQSRTYRKLPCSHLLCQGGRALYQCVNNECVYNIGYGGGASTRGIASFETFTFMTSTRFDNLIFGCSINNQNIQFAKNGVISGIMGLSFSPDSLVSQLADVTQKRFSYCMVPFTEAQMAPGIVRFGNDIPSPAATIHTTPFVTPPGSHYFHLNLLDITVETRRIGFAPGTFTYRQGGTGGFIIDSGALIPQLDQNANGRNAYREVMKAFQNHYDSFHLQRIGKVPEGFALCYKFAPGFDQFAALTYHLEGGDYVVDGKFVNFYERQEGYFCVAILPGNGKSILGAWHQQNMRVTHNGNINALQFSTEICAHDHP